MFLWNPKVYCHIHKGLPLVPLLSYMNPVVTLPLCSSKKYFSSANLAQKLAAMSTFLGHKKLVSLG